VRAVIFTALTLDIRQQMTLPMLRILPPPWDFRMMTSSTPGRDAAAERAAAERFMADKYESLRKLTMVPLQPPRNPNKPFTSFRINDILSPTSNERGSEPPPTRRPNRPASVRHKPESASPKSDHDAVHNRKIHSHTNRAHHGILRHHHSARPSDNTKSINNNLHHYNHAEHNRGQGGNVRIVRPWDASPSPGRTSEASSDADDEEIDVVDDDEEEEVADPRPSRGAGLKGVSPLDALMEMANKTFQGLETSEAAGEIQGILSVVIVVCR